jgi:signal transduction histidine kinase
MILRTALRYLAFFALVLAALSFGAYVFVSHEYTALLGPALPTQEGGAAFGTAMRRVALTIAALDAPLLLVFGGVSWLLAQASLAPLLAAQARERTFAADAAHALRSPLATIAAVAQSQRAKSDGQTAQAFETISGAALDASAVVGDLLTLARSAGSGALEREPVDVAALVARVAREFEERARERGVMLTCERRAAILEADERRLRELARNLLENALRHARSSIAVSVTRDDGAARISVWNDGESIAAERKTRIFERFYTGGGEAGNGLGLAIVAWVAQAHGGEVTVRDGERGGAEFVVRLPHVIDAS